MSLGFISRAVNRDGIGWVAAVTLRSQRDGDYLHAVGMPNWANTVKKKGDQWSYASLAGLQ